ncbi:hypothetical protein G6N82_02710 [Altererythrobacter sp. BO-6]|uniref:hypothetical protein n=1 Tax=Altererythrobacter sp. BO-6 TaxID=2604537 RepID=UPI0013E15F0C|nr:hypothetical protein [Altererythrobacter sp. BO-6]QIG53208.1 hypothetical protein G6N82_02710 [Altererythrobacter sp. BO-6]
MQDKDEATDWIDVWSIETFDDELLAELDCRASVIRDYFNREEVLWAEREQGGGDWPEPENPHAEGFIEAREEIGNLMKQRSIRAWHYTRLTDEEIDVLRREGIILSNLESFRTRLDAQVAAGSFDSEVADQLYASSPFQGDQRDGRLNKFWMVSHPLPTSDHGVQPLLESWGGEVTYFRQSSPDLKDLLVGLGQSRVIEVLVPLDVTSFGFSRAGDSVVATYARHIDCSAEPKIFDLYIEQALSPEHVLAVHSKGEPNFSALARGYPTGFTYE